MTGLVFLITVLSLIFVPLTILCICIIVIPCPRNRDTGEVLYTISDKLVSEVEKIQFDIILHYHSTSTHCPHNMTECFETIKRYSDIDEVRVHGLEREIKRFVKAYHQLSKPIHTLRLEHELSKLCRRVDNIVKHE